MRLAFLTLALALPAVSSDLPAAPPTPASAAARAMADPPSRLCRDELKIRPVRSREGAKARSLGDLPSGDLTLAVLNRVGDCIEPVTVRQGFGGLGRR